MECFQSEPVMVFVVAADQGLKMTNSSITVDSFRRTSLNPSEGRNRVARSSSSRLAASSL